MGKIDLMSFPDHLFCSQILTRLPLKEAVRFSAVSRKWCRAWTRLPHLKFSKEFFDSICTTLPKRKAVSKLTRPNMTADIINKIILMQGAGLETFELDNSENCGKSIHKWLLWISSSGVKRIDLRSRGIMMQVSESLFSCVTLSCLSLKNFKVTKVPAPFQGFPQLVTCHLEDVDLNEKVVEVIFKLCRLLQSLTVSRCVLPSELRIVSSSLKSLAVLPLCDETFSMEANCPRLESIKISECDGLVEVNMCLPVCVHLETDFESLQYFVTVKSLRKITCFNTVIFTDVEHLQSFPCLEELCIDFTKFGSHPKDVAELTLELPNLKTFTINLWLYDAHAVSLSSCILKGAPLLKTVRIGMNYKSETLVQNGVDCAFQIANAFLSLASAFPKTKFSLSRRTVNPGGR